MNEIQYWGIETLITDLKANLRNFYSLIYLEGEISSITERRFGYKCYYYMTIKDNDPNKKGVISALFVSGPNLTQEYQVGTRVKFAGALSIPEGKSQLLVRIEQLSKVDNTGELLKKIEQNRQHIIDNKWRDRIKALPNLVTRVGLITSDSGSVVHDMLRVFRNSEFNFEIIIYKASVEGANAIKSLTAALEVANQRKEVDLIIMARGGGSFTDLLPFSIDLGLLEAVNLSQIPVISAIGHSTDHPLLDLVSSYAVTTPTAAANFVVEQSKKNLDLLTRLNEKLIKNYLLKIDLFKSKIDSLIYNLMKSEPQVKISNYHRKLETAQSNLKFLVVSRIQNLMHQTVIYSQKTIAMKKEISNSIILHRMELAAKAKNVEELVNNKLLLLKQQLTLLHSKLELLSPVATLDRGWAAISNLDNSKVTSLKVDQLIKINTAKQKVVAQVKEIE